MQVFEFHFNPQLRQDLIFDSFCYEPENIYEKRVGSLYLVGLLKNVLPQNLHFLDKLQKVIQKEYYRSTVRKPEKALKESLKEANEFLEKEAKKGNVSWLGNLSFAALSLKDYQLNFTKVGDLKIFLLRGKRIIDIDRKLKFEEIAPWPLKIFGNIVSGKLAEGDILLVLTKEVTDFFEKENLLPEIGKLEPFNEKSLKEIFDKRKDNVLKISGILLIIILTKEALASKKELITPKSYPKEFNLKEAFAPYLKFFATRFNQFVNLFKILPKKLRSAKPSRLPFPKFSLFKFPQLPKNLLLILGLVFFLALGYFVSQLQEKKELKEHQATLQEIQQKRDLAESFLILKTPTAEKEAQRLLKESWEEISQLSKIVSHLPKDFQNQVFSLKDEVSKTLFELNKLEIIEEPELFFDFNRQQLIPQKMVFFKDGLYFFSPYSQNLFLVEENGQAEIIEIDQKFNLAAASDDSVLFFSKPNQLTILKEREPFSLYLAEPYAGLSIDDISVFREHLYFLDKKSGEIIKYLYLGDLKWGSPQLWLAREEKKVLQGLSLAVDGSIWLLDKNNSLSRYYAGRLQEKIFLEIFPEPKELKKIFTSPNLPYLYLLEPAQKRVVILDKKGQIIQQFQSQKFDNLLDFAISEDGKTIYLLNGLKVYILSI